MRIHVVTLFPEALEGALGSSILGRARRAGRVQVHLVDLRAYGEGRHRQTDDTPYGGGAGMVLMARPILRALEEVGQDAWRVLLTPRGGKFDQEAAHRLARRRELVLVCGHYEGVDERVAWAVDEELSVGDVVLTGGEPAAWVVVDAVVRLLPGVLEEDSLSEESFHPGSPWLEGPQFTRPREVGGMRVPDVLLTGDHRAVARWRRKQGLWDTWRRRPDLLRGRVLPPADAALLREAWQEARAQGETQEEE